MPARILLVYDDDSFLHSAVTALREARHDVFGVADPMEALAALDRPHNVELLITHIEFAPGQPNGVALALMAKHNRPPHRSVLKVLFVDKPELHQHAEDVGECMAEPVAIADLLAAADRLLGPIA
jgi:DNA-binding NtrC family response regulator